MVVEGGLTYYRMSNAYNPLLSFQGDNTQGRDTQELYFRTRFMLPLSPTFSIQQDIDHRASTYLMASANKSLTFGRQWDLNVMGSMGLQIGRGVDIYRDALVRANLGYKVAPFVKLNGVVDLAIPSHQVNPGAKGLAPAFTVSMSYAPPF